MTSIDPERSRSWHNDRGICYRMAASKAGGVLYVGRTRDLAGRAWEHRERVMDGFTYRSWAVASSTTNTMKRPLAPHARRG
jgi:predicted GIY-YIG superfamily endonuclease